MFPWVCLATMPLFYPFDWPKISLKFIRKKFANIQKYIVRDQDRYEKREVCKAVEQKEKQEINGVESDKNTEAEVNNENEDNQFSNTSEMLVTQHSGEKHKGVKERQNLTVLFILFHVISQGFLPYSHFITQVRKNYKIILIIL